jgi:hypothetical protein
MLIKSRFKKKGIPKDSARITLCVSKLVLASGRHPGIKCDHTVPPPHGII